MSLRKGLDGWIHYGRMFYQVSIDMVYRGFSYSLESKAWLKIQNYPRLFKAVGMSLILLVLSVGAYLTVGVLELFVKKEVSR